MPIYIIWFKINTLRAFISLNGNEIEVGLLNFVDCLRDLITKCGILISLLLNVLWISKSFLQIQKWSEEGIDCKPHFLVRILKKSESSKAYSYSYLFFDKTVEFLLISSAEITICYWANTNLLSESLALTIPLITVFIISSCFITSQNEKFLSQVATRVGRQTITSNIQDFLRNLEYPIRIINNEIGSFLIDPKILEIEYPNLCVFVRLDKIKVDDNQEAIELSFTENLKDKKKYCLPEELIEEWQNIKIKSQGSIKLHLIYKYRSKDRNEEDEVNLIVRLNISDNQLAFNDGKY